MNIFKLSLKDRKILRELNMNSRQSFSAIGKKIGLPKNVVNYRVKRLVDEGVITLFCTTVNRSRLGFQYCRLFLKFQHFSEKFEKELIEYVKELNGIYWVARLDGVFDFCIIYLARNMQELSETYDLIINRCGSAIVEKEFNLATRLWYLPYNYLYDKSENVVAEVKPEAAVSLEKKDWLLLGKIKENARIPMLTLMKELKMSPRSISKRIHDLTKRKIITGFTIRVDHTKFKLHHFHTFLYLDNVDEKSERRLINFLIAQKSSTHVIKSTGKCGLEFESVLPSYFEMHELLKELKNKFPDNVVKYDTALIFKIYPINTVKYE